MSDPLRQSIADDAADKGPAQSRDRGDAADEDIGSGKIEAANPLEIGRHPDGQAAECKGVRRISEHRADVRKIPGQSAERHAEGFRKPPSFLTSLAPRGGSGIVSASIASASPGNPTA